MGFAKRRHADIPQPVRHPGRPPAAAQGLMQLMPATAALMGVDDRLDPRQNVFGGAKYLSQLLDRFNGNMALALAGYNAGPTKVARYRGIPPYRETRGYVTRVRG